MLGLKGMHGSVEYYRFTDVVGNVVGDVVGDVVGNVVGDDVGEVVGGAVGDVSYLVGDRSCRCYW